MKRKNGGEEKSSYFKPHPAPSDALSDNDDESKNNNLMPSGVSNSHSFRTQKSHPHEESKDETENSDDSYIRARSSKEEESKEDNDPTEESKETTALYIANMAWIKHIREFKPSPSKFQLIDKKEKAAAQKIIRGFKSYKETTPNDCLFSRQEILKELESISQTAMKNWCFSTTAINSFIHTKGSDAVATSKNAFNNYLVHENRVGYRKFEEWREKWNKAYPKIKGTHIKRYVGDFYSDLVELSNGNANCGRQAIILRAYLINTLPPDILKQIGNKNIIVAEYKGIDHAFVVIKRFYGKSDEPADCLVIDTWIAQLYLPENRRYRPEAAYPISHQYYRKFLENTNEELERTMAREFPKQGDTNDHERKPYMGRMQDHFNFLLDHADGYYVPKSFTAGLKLVDVTFSILKHNDAYNSAYKLIKEC
jgi:hypothetical protein